MSWTPTGSFEWLAFTNDSYRPSANSDNRCSGVRTRTSPWGYEPLMLPITPNRNNGGVGESRTPVDKCFYYIILYSLL